MAIDRTRLVESLSFGQTPAFGFVPPGTWNYESQSWPWRDLGDAERVAEAKRLYAAAGFSQRAPLRLHLLYNSNPAIKHTAIVVASMWRETLGIDTELNDEEYRVFLQTRHDRSRWDVVRLAWSADFNDASNFLDTLRVHSSNNDPGYVNPAFDEMLDQAAGSADPTRRRELLERSERLMLSDYPLVPLYYFVSKRLVKPYLQGVIANPMNHIRSQSLQLHGALTSPLPRQPRDQKDRSEPKSLVSVPVFSLMLGRTTLLGSQGLKVLVPVLTAICRGPIAPHATAEEFMQALGHAVSALIGIKRSDDLIASRLQPPRHVAGFSIALPVVDRMSPAPRRAR